MVDNEWMDRYIALFTRTFFFSIKIGYQLKKGTSQKVFNNGLVKHLFVESATKITNHSQLVRDLKV